MHDIELIRKMPDYFDLAMQKRGVNAVAQRILDLDRQNRELLTKLQSLKEKKNILVGKIGVIKTNGGNIEHLSEEVKLISVMIKELEADQDNYELQNLLATLPNIAEGHIPVGDDESSNVEIRKYGLQRQFSFKAKTHYDLGVESGLMDFENAAKISGSRFVIITGLLAKLERALISFMLDLHTREFSYTEVSHPYLVREQAMYGVGQLPKFDNDSFKTTNGFRLIPTSEVFLTNIVANTILEEKTLPLRFVASAPCFRSEAGSAGRDTRGIIRQHQFDKVELVSITRPQDSRLELERMTGIAEEVLKLLRLPYRVMLLSTGDLGFSAQITYDIEVWFPSQNTYREISSCSNCGSFQARRMKARYKRHGENKNIFVHTLNGSALAIGRTVAAIMENYQNDDGSITIPEVLRPYMDNKLFL